MRKIILVFSWVCLALYLPAFPAYADPIEGLWYTENHEGGVEFYKCGAEICGRLYWLEDSEQNGDVSRDIHNSDTTKRPRPLCRLQFMGGFKPEEGGHYADGWIYSPRHGANFSAEMTLVNHDTLDLRGYLLFSFLGETQTWTRAKKMPKCSLTLTAKAQ